MITDNDIDYYETIQVEVYPNVFWKAYYNGTHLVVYDNRGLLVDDILLEEFKEKILEKLEIYDN